MRALLLLLVFLSPTYALAGASSGARTVTWVKALNAATAGANHTSSNAMDTAAYGAPIDMGLAMMGSVQCDWTGLTGTVNATVQVNISDDGAANWLAKSSGQITLSGASGSAYLPFAQTPEQLYQLVYTAGTVTGGTVSCWVFGK